MKSPQFKFRLAAKVISIVQLVLITWYAIVFLVSVGMFIATEENSERGNVTYSVENIAKNETRLLEEAVEEDILAGNETLEFSGNETATEVQLSDIFNITNVVPIASASYVSGGLLWLVIVMMGVIVVVEYVADIKLLQASTLGADPEIALGQASFWRTAVIVLGLLDIIHFSLVESWVCVGVSALIRIVFLLIGWQFINELKVATATEKSEKA